MNPESPVFLALDLTGTFVFALGGALTALRATRVDLVGVVVLGMCTALGGGMVRDVLLGSLPPATFADWRYLGTAGVGSMVAFAFSHRLGRLTKPILVLDAAGLSLFAVSGAFKAVDLEAGFAQAVLLGTITAVGGGTLRDVLIREVPSVLSSDFYAIPALLGALMAVGSLRVGVDPLVTAVLAVMFCFVLRVAGLRFRFRAPMPRDLSRRR